MMSRKETKEEELTPVEILEHAKIDPKTHYLHVQIKGKERISYKDEPAKKIRMRNGMRLLCLDRTNARLRLMPLQDFINQLKELGYEVTDHEITKLVCPT